MTRDETIRLGEAATRALSDEGIVEALSQMESECTESWANSGIDQSAQREDAYRMLICVRMVTAKLRAFESNAQLELHNRDRERKPHLVQA